MIQQHGSIPYRELEKLHIDPSAIVDFSASINPYKLPKSFLPYGKLIDSVRFYPDRDSFAIVKAIGDYLQLPESTIGVCAGTTELIYTLPFISKKPLLFTPTYRDYKDSFTRKSRKTIDITVRDIESIEDTVLSNVRRYHPDLVVICNPNNPTGWYLTPEQIDKLCKSAPECLICIDEAYQELGENCRSCICLIKRRKNLLVIKSLSKPFGIPGLRCGYFVGAKQLIDKLRSYMVPWAIPPCVDSLIPLLYSNIDIFKKQWSDTLGEKKRLVLKIKSTGYVVPIQPTPFFLVKVPHSLKVRNWLLLKHHLHVRECTSCPCCTSATLALMSGTFFLTIVNLARCAPPRLSLRLQPSQGRVMAITGYCRVTPRQQISDLTPRDADLAGSRCTM
jgi:threonine-phosphate decarboxylase